MLSFRKLIKSQPTTAFRSISIKCSDTDLDPNHSLMLPCAYPACFSWFMRSSVSSSAPFSPFVCLFFTPFFTPFFHPLFVSFSPFHPVFVFIAVFVSVLVCPHYLLLARVYLTFQRVLAFTIFGPLHDPPNMRITLEVYQAFQFAKW